MRSKNKIKDRVSTVLCAVALTLMSLLTSCTDTIPEDGNDTVTETAEVMYRSDLEIHKDMSSIEVSGKHDVRILFINAGRADSILIEADGRHYLIDTGEETSVPRIAAALEYMEVERLDAVFLTHSNNDHISGLPHIAELCDIDKCYTAAIATEMTKIQNSISRASLEQTLLEPGQVIEISEGLYFEVLGPIRYDPLDENDNSLVLRMQVNGRCVLFAGDMQFNEEKTLMRAGFDLRCDILKVGNHGNKDATSVSFMEETSPDYAIITTDRDIDENSAHKSIRNGLRDVGAEVMVTDEYDLGILCEISHKGNISFKNAKWEPISEDIVFVSVSKAEQLVTIRNEGKEEVELSGWFIVSERGGELFRFPDGSVIEGGAEVTVASNDHRGEADYMWGAAKVWHKSKDDTAILIDSHGNLIDTLPSSN